MNRTTVFPPVGSDVSVVFLDHCQDGERAVRCTVRGIIVRTTAREVLIESWTTHSANSQENRTRFSIVRSAIESMSIKTESERYEQKQPTADEDKAKRKRDNETRNLELDGTDGET